MTKEDLYIKEIIKSFIPKDQKDKIIKSWTIKLPDTLVEASLRSLDVKG